MAEQMILENYPWDSDEAQDWESDEAIAESDESAEDIGEAAPRRRKVPVARGVRGMTVRTPSGPQNYSFPQRLTTTAETNRVSANVELSRRRLEERLDRFEARARAQRKSDISSAGAVTLLLGGGLTIWGITKASQQGFTLNSWANQESTEISAGISAMQLATTGVKLAMTGHYPRTALGTAGDLFAAAQLAAFAFGSLSTSSAPPIWAKPPIVLNQADLDGTKLQSLKPYDLVVTRDTHRTALVLADSTMNNNTYRYLESGID